MGHHLCSIKIYFTDSKQKRPKVWELSSRHWKPQIGPIEGNVRGVAETVAQFVSRFSLAKVFSSMVSVEMKSMLAGERHETL